MKSTPKYKRDGAALWLDTAYAILVEDGHGGLTIEQLSARTGKTRGSFYHHFGSHDGFIARLLDDWRKRNTEQIEHKIAAAPEPRVRRTILNHQASQIDTRIETAIRRWAGSHQTVAQACRAVDQRRMALIARDLSALAISQGVLLAPEKADALALIDYAVFLGAQILAPKGKLDALPDSIVPTIEDMLSAYLRQLQPISRAAATGRLRSA